MNDALYQEYNNVRNELNFANEFISLYSNMTNEEQRKKYKDKYEAALGKKAELADKALELLGSMTGL